MEYDNFLDIKYTGEWDDYPLGTNLQGKYPIKHYCVVLKDGWDNPTHDILRSLIPRYMEQKINKERGYSEERTKIALLDRDYLYWKAKRKFLKNLKDTISNFVFEMYFKLYDKFGLGVDDRWRVDIDYDNAVREVDKKIYEI